MALDLSRFEPLDPPTRLLMGPGPSLVHPRVLAALAAPTVGHLDPTFLARMDEIQTLLRAAYGTDNELTFAVSGTGSAGMEACLVNAIEPGDRVVVAQHGVFGGRIAEIASRAGADVARVEAGFGEGIDLQRLEDTVKAGATKLVAVVHAETSTGVHQSLPEVAAIAHAANALCLADCVTSLGGMHLALDAWGVDMAYAATQKCLGCPPGLSPVTFSPRALDRLRARSHRVSSWYLDASLLLGYWGGDRVYHHTAPINMLYALREALLLFFEEGPECVFARHRLQHRALVAGLEAMGLSMLVEPALRLPQLNTVCVPSGVDDGRVRRTLLSRFDVEIGAGLGPLAGKVWRIGLMGHTAHAKHVATVLATLEAALAEQGALRHPGRALEAARAVWDEEAT